MIFPFFTLAAQSPGRQHSFRRAVTGHVIVSAFAAWVVYRQSALPLLGHLLLVAGIVEGAVLIGWRLAQLPRSRALEFLLVSPLRPRGLFLAEACVGVTRLAFVTLSGLPVLLFLTVTGRQDPSTHSALPPALLHADLVPLLVMPFTWGTITGVGLALWAYEPHAVRRWGERVFLAGIVLYLGVGLLAGEHLVSWLLGLREWGSLFLRCFRAFHQYNPFGVLQYWLENFGMTEGETEVAWAQFLWLEAGSLVAVILFTLRAAARLQGHFQDRHYGPVLVRAGQGVRQEVDADRPLAWWAVRRVTEYSGRVNLWLAGGFGILYALYTVVGPEHWPMGRLVFILFEERMGGIPALAAALVVLSAVPAAFQYGLWDSNAQDRCRRLELLLLTRLEARDYWEAAAAAAWRRGRGYFAIALSLWVAAAVGDRGNVRQLAALTAALASGVVLWGLYFALGFRAFSRGVQANRLGTLLTLGLPLLAFVLFRAGLPAVAELVPPGSVYGPAAGSPVWQWLAGPLLGGVVALFLGRYALHRCDRELRRWYNLHHGHKVVD